MSGSTASKLPDYTALSKELATATPTGTNMASYTATATEVRACPTIGADWAASSNLPPIANSELCECMVKSLSCVASTSLSGNTTADLFDYICAANSGKACVGITANATTGSYGAYSMCTANQQLSFAMNAYYNLNSKASTACDFSGSGSTQKAATASTCSTLLSQAGTSGTGTVTSAATATGDSSSSGSSAASSSTAGAPGSINMAYYDDGNVKLGLYIVVATLSGIGMLAL